MNGDLLGGDAPRLQVQLDSDARDRARDLAISELKHRLGNAYTQILALIALTDRPDLDKAGFIEELRRRILFLNDVNRRLAGGDWRPGSVSEILDAALAPVMSDWRERIEVKGADVPVGGRMAMALSLIVHELVTNSLKHGGLGLMSAKPAIAWRMEQSRLVFEWREAAPVETSTSRGSGFGSVLLSRLAPGEVAGTARYELGPEGVVYRLDAPLEEPL